MLKIGTLKLPSNIMLAPLAGISDSSFRLICREFGARFTFIEMINARAISHKSKKTKKMLSADPRDKPLGVQLLGAEIPYILKAMDVLKPYGFDLLDFNAACPVRKVWRRGEGAALMKEPKKLRSILEAMTRSWEGPLTIKIRSGINPSHHNAVDIAKIAEDAGVAAVFIHGRDREQFYRGTVDYNIIAAVKKNVRIPVIASGDILSAPLAKKMFDETGADGLLVARGALGRPWIFQEIDALLKKRLYTVPHFALILETMLRHLDYAALEHGEKNAVPIMRKFVGWYLKGQPHIRAVRHKISAVKTREDFCAIAKAAGITTPPESKPR
jgi:tRNA-dihydrouridine synthase B